MSVARRHHTVPNFYLKGFATEANQIGVVQLPGTRRFVQATSDATIQKDFYAIPGHADGPDVFEKGLSELEGDTTKIFRKITDDGVWPLSQADREVLATFLTVQFLRGPDQRRHMEQTMALLTRLEVGAGGKAGVKAWAKREHGLSVSPDQAEQIWNETTQPGGPPIKLAPVGHIRQMLELTPELISYFAARPWQIYQFSRRSLLTCDAPVSLIPNQHAHGDEGTGLMNAWAITVPLSRRTGLLLGDPEAFFGKISGAEVSTGRFDHRGEPSTAVARMFNDATIGNARQWIYHHPDDKAIVPEKLPEPRAMEIQTSGAPEQFSGEPFFGRPSETPSQ